MAVDGNLIMEVQKPYGFHAKIAASRSRVIPHSMGPTDDIGYLQDWLGTCYEAGRMNGTERLQLRKELKAALAANRTADKAARTAAKAARRATSKAALAASNRALNAFLAALVANEAANAALAKAHAHDARAER